MISQRTLERLSLAIAIFMVLLTLVVACSDYQNYKAKVASCLAKGGSEVKCTGRITGIDN